MTTCTTWKVQNKKFTQPFLYFIIHTHKSTNASTAAVTNDQYVLNLQNNYCLESISIRLIFFPLFY